MARVDVGVVGESAEDLGFDVVDQADERVCIAEGVADSAGESVRGGQYGWGYLESL